MAKKLDLSPPNFQTPGVSAKQAAIVKNCLTEIIEKFADPAKQPQIQVFMFGSRVTGSFRKDSDLDLYFLGTGTLAPRFWTHLEEAFEESDLPFKVDLIDASKISAAIKGNIENLDKVQIYPE
jgi:predicted nucleotidyltransferase